MSGEALGLRQSITEYMKIQRRQLACTWWFKLNIPYDTKTVRRELEAMEREGLVTADRTQRNNTMWTLVASAEEVSP